MPERFVGQPKKQFGAPFLDGNKVSDQIEAAFQATGLDGKAISSRVTSELQRLKKIINPSQSGARTSDEIQVNSTENPIQIDARFELTNLNQLIQTTASLAIVQKTLVDGNQLQRDLDYESRLLAREQIFPPAN
jgi:hypothetical protein